MNRSIYHKHVLTIFLVLLSINLAYSQNRVFQGKVLDDDDLEPIIGAWIFVNDSIKVGETGRDGCFQIETKIPVNKLSFWYVGMENADLILSENCNQIELIMISSAYYDFMSFRKINKIRRKLYKNLPRLHKEAYEKGIFQSPEACYTQEFIEY